MMTEVTWLGPKAFFNRRERRGNTLRGPQMKCSPSCHAEERGILMRREGFLLRRNDKYHHRAFFCHAEERGVSNQIRSRIPPSSE